MEKEIQDYLDKCYKNIDIKVNYTNFREYDIYVSIDNKGIQYDSKIEFIYDNHFTLYQNCNKIVNIINQIILDLFKK